MRSCRCPLTRSPRSRCAGREVEGVLVARDRRAGADPPSGCRGPAATAPVVTGTTSLAAPFHCSPLLWGSRLGWLVRGSSGIVRRRRVHRVVVQPAGDVDRRHQADPPAIGPPARTAQPVEAVVERAAERPVGLDGRPALPASPRVARDHVDQARERLPVARREAVGDERRLAQQVGRDAESEPAARRVELVLDAESVQDERLLADPAAAVALAHAAGAQRDRLLERADRQVPQVRGADLLLGARGQRVEQLVHRRGDHERRQLTALASSAKSRSRWRPRGRTRCRARRRESR